MAETAIPSSPNVSHNVSTADTGTSELSQFVEAINNLAGRDVVLVVNDREFARATGAAMAVELQNMKITSSRGRGIK